MKKVLLIANQIPHYRVSVYNYLSRRFLETGWELKVASDRMLRESNRDWQWDFYELQFTFSNYRRLVKELNPDVVILHLHLKIAMFWPLIHWLKLKRIPVISWTKGANLERSKSRLRYEIFNYAHRLSDALLMYSPNEITHVKVRHRGKIFVANNTVNFEEYPQINESREQIKEELGLPFEKLVLFVGTMGIGGERKRVKHLIKAFDGISRADVGLVVVGSGMSQEIRASINSVTTRVFGAVHDPANVKISKLFKVADLYVVPGHVGLGINQAFYWGLPVITENCNQPPEIHYLHSGRNGYIVPDNDVGALREKILYLLDNDEVRAEFSRNARTDIQKCASIEAMFQSFRRAIGYVCLEIKNGGHAEYGIGSEPA